jgi:uncharacterized protein YjbI with pentapeptide repeats
MTETSSSGPLVRPRVLSQHTAEQLLLEDYLEPLLERNDAGAICIFGEPGTGKSSALRAVAGRLPRRTIIELLDNPGRAQVADLAERMIVIYSAAVPHELPHLAKVWIASWGEDEALEYLMAAHKDRCASVMTRLRAARVSEPLDLPELWTICLDRMAEDDSIPDVDAALRRHLDLKLSASIRTRARDICFKKAVDSKTEGVDEVQLWGHQGFLGFLMGAGLSAKDVRLVRYPRIRRILAAEKLVNPDTGVVHLEGLLGRLPQPLIAMAGRSLSQHPVAHAALESSIQDQVGMQSSGASLLHAAGTGWRPADEGKIRWLWRAHLPGVLWKGLKLPQAQFNGAELTGANLRGAMLDGAEFENARLRHALLSEASLHRIDGSNADLEGADLSRALASNCNFFNANLRGADFEGASLQRSRFLGANLTRTRFCRADLRAVYFQMNVQGDDWMNSFASAQEALEYLEKKGYKPDGIAHRQTLFSESDFTGANLQGAWMQSADLRTCTLSGALLMTANLGAANLEGMTISGARFEQARLQSAVLTGSVMPGATFHRAFLQHARLAEIDWERADLREANLTKVTFHLGSSRSGLVFGEPSEGTRKGFYTDDFNDQSYRSPEEIRVANLRGADLRGAILRDTDFYLVDLREAHYTPEQEVYFRRCGAILETRV